MVQSFFTSFRWQSQSVFGRPSSFESAMDCTLGYIYNFRPFCYCLCLIVESYEAIRSLISMLLSRCRPSAIFWRVVTIIINSINRIFRGWSLSHISKKVLKRINPALTDSYSASTVIFILINIFIVASLFYTNPDFIFRDTVFAMFGSLFFLVTTTTYSCFSFSFQFIATDNFRISTFTLAFPASSSIFNVRKFNHFQSSKFLPCEIDFPGTSTTLDVTTFDIVRFGNNNVATITTRSPISSTSTGSIHIFQYSQLIEFFTRYVYSFHRNFFYSTRVI